VEITEEIKDKLIEVYNKDGIGCNKLAEMFGIGRTSATRIINRYLINSGKYQPKLGKYRKYSLNEQYFDIVGPRQSYWLGWLLTDGYHDEGGKEIILELQAADKEILEKFNSDLESNRPLLFIEEKSKHPTWDNGYRLMVNSSYMSNRLRQLGFRQKKSFNLNLDVLKECISIDKREFIRGFFDGNGGLHLRYNKNSVNLKCQIDSTVSACHVLIEVLKDFNFRYVEKANKPELAQLIVSTTEDSFNFVSWLYKDCSIYLNRKYEKYLKFISLYKGA